jgi:hypothetical protein
MTDPMVKLTDLNAKFLENPNRIVFNCPRCRQGIVSVWVKQGDPGLDGVTHGCDRVPPDLTTVTITPSIADEAKCTASNRGCPGWHGHIINGEVR